ncbi:TetR-like C-terminal domain-containing protein [Amycolatopsis jejuensis]|uniref:TetR-like C-terminal domain-containing protein n=1 Tax=Amycolatopsis jejuensis TaxID=330084 RepID=UPI00068F8733|nr:TetR-like C-terminal domain-containing protein [Amycolatopsis jejuensis]
MQGQHERDRLPLERAVARGELRSDVYLDCAVEQLVGPIYYRVLVAGGPVPPEFTDQVVDGFLDRSAWEG